MSTRQVRIVKTSTRPVVYGSRPVVSTRTVTSRPVISRRVVSTNYPTSSYTSYSSPVVQRTVHHTSVSPRDPLRVKPSDTETFRTTSSSNIQTSHPPSFTDLQHNMESELEGRRSNWEKEVEQMQEDFFNVKTSDPKDQDEAADDAVVTKTVAPRVSSDILEVGNSKELYHDQGDGTKVYRKRFDLSGFSPEELSVKIENGKLYISANREEDFGGSKSTRQFNRTVDLPDPVDEENISSSLNDDGILTIEAPVDESKIQKREDPIPAIMSTTEVVDPAFDNFGAYNPPGYGHVIRSTYRSGDGPGVVTRTTTTSSSTPAGNPRRFRCIEVEETPQGPKLKTDMYLGKKYKAEDITVKVYDHKLSVEAKSEDVVGGRTARRQFARDVSIPEAVERDTLRAMFAPDGKIYLGGSFVTNTDHDAILQSVMDDMPPGSKDCNIVF